MTFANGIVLPPNVERSRACSSSPRIPVQIAGTPLF
jgi:hypothetical protein